MNCIWNHCNEHIALDIAVITYYASAVGLTIIFALLSQSKSIKTAALMISTVWLFSLLYFLAIGGTKYFLTAAFIDAILAYQFWRMAKTEAFPAPLCCLMIADVTFVAIATLFSFTEFWTIFVLNRIFELTLAYMIGASIYRIRKLRPPDDNPAKAGDSSFKFIAG